jgi:hypothetical protein
MTTIEVMPDVIRPARRASCRPWPPSGPIPASTRSPQGGSMSRCAHLRPVRQFLPLTIVANPAWKRSDQAVDTGSPSADA